MISRTTYPRCLFRLPVFGLLFIFSLLLSLSAGAQVEGDSSMVDSVQVTTVDTSGTVVDSPAYTDDDDSGDDEPDPRLPDTLELRAVPDSTVARLRNSEAFAYANDPAYWVKEEPEHNKDFWDYLAEFFSHRTARMSLIIIMLGILLYALYRIIVSNNMFIFYRNKSRGGKAEDTAFADIDDDGLDEKIRDAERQSDFRMATRLQYLRTLKMMNDKGWIQYHPEATNYEYLLQLGTHPASTEFAFLTRAYEFCWYGGFQVSASQYELLKRRFEGLVKPGSR